MLPTLSLAATPTHKCPCCGRHTRPNAGERNVWTSMISRCHGSPKYNSWPRYGGRGITVCQRWRDSFDVFLADIGPRPTSKHQLDREDNDGNYEPSNCRWVTAVINQRNKSNMRILEYDGKAMCANAWDDYLGRPRGLTASRRTAGWTMQRNVETPRGYARRGVPRPLRLHHRSPPAIRIRAEALELKGTAGRAKQVTRLPARKLVKKSTSHQDPRYIRKSAKAKRFERALRNGLVSG